jgi:hypothetical protein
VFGSGKPEPWWVEMVKNSQNGSKNGSKTGILTESLKKTPHFLMHVNDKTLKIFKND